MKDKKKSCIGLGVCLGVAFGLIFDNLAIGVCIGIAIGAGFDAQKSK